MRLHSKLLVVASLFITACSDKPAPTTTAQPTPSASVSTEGSKPSVEAEKPADSGAAAAGQAADATATPDTGASQPTPVALDAGVAKLGPENTKVLFVGTHVGDKPDPRTGGFERFSGEVKVDADAKALAGLSVKIETDSLWTQIGQLTQHLKSPDFFEVREYPSIDFESTSIKAGTGEGTYDVTGNLTLHGVTKEISFPVTAQITEGGLTLTSQFSVNRTDYGMTFSPERVVDKVELTVVVGEKTAPLPAQGFGPGGGGGGPPGAGAPGAGAPPADAPDGATPDSGAAEPEAEADQEGEEPENKDPSASP